MTVDLSTFQKRFLTLAARTGLRPPNITSVFELFGDISPEDVCRSLVKATERHGLFRLQYTNDWVQFEEGVPNGEPIAVREMSCAADAVLSEIAKVAQAQQERDFLPGECPLLTGTLLHVNTARWFLVLTVDHMISDGLSVGMLIREMCLFYLGTMRGRAVSLPRLPASYADHVRAEAELVKTNGPERRAWWQHTLAGFKPAHPEEPDALGPVGAVKATIPAAVFGEITAHARKHELSISAVILCAYTHALTKAGLGDDLLVNKAISNRSENLRGVFGDFMNLVPTRIRPAGKDPVDLYRDICRDVDASREHQLPYWTLVEWLFPELYFHPYGACNIWFNYFPPHNQRLINAPEIGVELIGDATPAPKWTPCSVCLNVQPMLSGEVECLLLSNTSDVPAATRETILGEIESALGQSMSWLTRL